MRAGGATDDPARPESGRPAPTATQEAFLPDASILSRRGSRQGAGGSSGGDDGIEYPTEKKDNLHRSFGYIDANLLGCW
jgi:hypothetical protein